MQIAKEYITMSAQELTDVITVAARYEWLKQHSILASVVTAMPPEKWDNYIDRAIGDGLPTMGDQAEEELSAAWMCTCGNPGAPGVLHRADAPCYIPETAHEF